MPDKMYTSLSQAGSKDLGVNPKSLNAFTIEPVCILQNLMLYLSLLNTDLTNLLSILYKSTKFNNVLVIF
jgi:hypothetical protein